MATIKDPTPKDWDWIRRSRREKATLTPLTMPQQGLALSSSCMSINHGCKMFDQSSSDEEESVPRRSTWCIQNTCVFFGTTPH
ncbi:hypothetical protein MRX96_044531 [Rhipicephalus microplus]